MKLEQEVRDQLIEALKEIASRAEKVTYGEMAALVGLDMRRPPDRTALGRLLQAVCKTESASGRPLLGSVVVRKDTGMPGESYFKVARQLRSDGSADDREFHRVELARVYEQWAE